MFDEHVVASTTWMEFDEHVKVLLEQVESEMLHRLVQHRGRKRFDGPRWRRHVALQRTDLRTVWKIEQRTRKRFVVKSKTNCFYERCSVKEIALDFVRCARHVRASFVERKIC